MADQRNSETGQQATPVSRRQLFKRLAGPSLLLGTGLVLAACGKKPGTLRIPPNKAGTVSRNTYPPQDDDL